MLPSTSGRATALRRVIVLLQATLLAMTLAIAPAAPAVAPVAAAGADFTIGVLPDTQNLSQANYTAETTWFANNKTPLNLAFVAHLGDITNDATTAQFTAASAAQQVLDDAHIPNSVLPGNHDGYYSNWANYTAAFPVSRYSGETWWGGDYDGSNRNSYQTFTAGGLDFIIVSLEYSPSAGAMSWASGILAANPSRRAVVATHDYLVNTGARDTTGDAIWNGVVKSNCNVFMVVSGHIHPGDAHSTDTNTCGDTVHQVLQDWQDNTSAPEVRYFTFKPSANSIEAYNILPPSGTASLAFTLAYDMGTVVEPTLPGAPTGVSAVAGSASAQVSWTAPASNGGSAITDYQVTPYAGATAGTPVLVGSAAVTKNVTGLTNGTAYTFKVAAINTVGTGADSAASSAVTPQAPAPGWTAYIDTRVTADPGGNDTWFLPSSLGTLPADPFSGAADTKVLKNHANGAALPVSVQLDAAVDVSSDNGNNSTTGDAVTYFGDRTTRIVDQRGVYSFTNGTGRKFSVIFTGLDNAKSYTVVVGADRADTASPNVNRWSQFQLTGAGAFTQPGTTIANAYIVGNSGATVAFHTGNNTSGYIARWTGVTAGGDGTFSVASNYFANPSGTTDTSSYPPSAVMLQEEGSAGPSAPGAPTGVSAVAGDTSAHVSWTAPSSDGGSPITGYVVTPYIGATAQTPKSVGNATTTSVTSLTNGQPYTFKVAAINENGMGAQSAASNAVTPHAPLGDWTAFADLRSSTSDSNAANVLEIPEGTIDQYGTGSPINPATSFTLTDLSSGLDTDARLQVDNSGLNISSDNGSDFTAGPAYEVFESIVDGAGVYSAKAGAVFQVNLSGLDPAKRYTIVVTSNRNQDPANRSSDPNGDERWSDFELLGAVTSVEASGGTTTVVSPTQVRFPSENNTARGDLGRWTDIDPGADGAFSVKSNVYLQGDADRSYVPVQLMLQETTVVKTPQTIAFDPLTDRVLTDSPIAVSATASSGLTVSFSSLSEPVCTTTSGGTVTLVAVGTCTIQADQAGNGTYAAAAPVTQSFEVTAVSTTFNLSGTVTVGGTGLVGAAVHAFDSVTNAYFGTSVTTAGGAYSFKLDPGSYKLFVQPYNPAYRDQWLGGPDFASADPIILNANTTGVEIALVTTFNLSGTVTVGGTGLVGAAVHAFDSVTNAYFGTSVTTAGGAYSFKLDPGSYKLFVQPYNPAYRDQWLGGPDFASADPIILNANTTGVEIALVTTFNLSGTVTVGGTGLVGAAVHAFDSVTNAYFGTSVTTAGGAYSFKLDPGSYKLFVQPYNPAYRDQWLGGPDFASADPIILNANTTGVEIALVTTFNLSGTVTVGGTGLVGAAVHAFDSVTNAYFGTSVTTAGGAYSFKLDPGSYKLFVQPYNPAYRDQWLGGPDFASADPIILNANTTGVEIALVTTFNLSGTVTVGGTGLVGAAVHAFDSVTNAYFGTSVTTAGGAYSFKLDPGSYKLFVQPYNPAYRDQWLGGPDFASADPIILNANTTGVEIALVTP